MCDSFPFIIQLAFLLFYFSFLPPFPFAIPFIHDLTSWSYLSPCIKRLRKYADFGPRTYLHVGPVHRGLSRGPL